MTVSEHALRKLFQHQFETYLHSLPQKPCAGPTADSLGTNSAMSPSELSTLQGLANEMLDGIVQGFKDHSTYSSVTIPNAAAEVDDCDAALLASKAAMAAELIAREKAEAESLHARESQHLDMQLQKRKDQKNRLLDAVVKRFGNRCEKALRKKDDELRELRLAAGHVTDGTGATHPEQIEHGIECAQKCSMEGWDALKNIQQHAKHLKDTRDSQRLTISLKSPGLVQSSVKRSVDEDSKKLNEASENAERICKYMRMHTDEDH